MSDSLKKPHSLMGKVISSKMNKTITVLVERKVPHPLYGKFIKRSTKILVHDENNESSEGDVVLVDASRPLSNRKVWRLQKVLSKAV